MARNLDPEKRRALETRIKDRKPSDSLRDVAKEIGVSVATVLHYANVMGIKWAERSEQQNKIAAVQAADSRVRMQQIRARLLDEADLLVDSLHKPWLAYNFGGRDNDYSEHHFDEPDVPTKKAIVTTVAIIIDKSVAIEKLSIGDNPEARSMWERFILTMMPDVGDYDPSLTS